jgi:hypothetical protein
VDRRPSKRQLGQPLLERSVLGQGWPSPKFHFLDLIRPWEGFMHDSFGLDNVPDLTISPLVLYAVQFFPNIMFNSFQLSSS